jgi:type III pantothenate kinase
VSLRFAGRGAFGYREVTIDKRVWELDDTFASDERTGSAPTDDLHRLVICAGNTQIHVGVCQGGRLAESTSLLTADVIGEPHRLDAVVERWLDEPLDRIVIACVVPRALEQLTGRLGAALGAPCAVIGHDVPLPMPLALDEPETVGVDRVCAAAAAYDRRREACVVVDFGTATTVNAVSDDGVFLGGAILPGLRLSARALHEHTAALPLVDINGPPGAVGRTTRDAIRIGLLVGLRGAVREVVEGISVSFGKWPYLIFTGGEAQVVGQGCDFVDAIVPDLGLLGADLADRRHCHSQT